MQCTMIRCKTFLFKPSGNGIVNFAYKLVLDDEMVREAEKVFEEEMEKNEREGEAMDKDCGEGSLAQGTFDYYYAQAVKQQIPTIPSRPASQILPAKPLAITQTPLSAPVDKKLQPTLSSLFLKRAEPKVSVTEQPSDNLRPVSVPKSRLAKKPLAIMPAISEESEKDLEKLENERKFYEEFCEGIMPPPENDDWSEQAPAALSPEEIVKLGYKRTCDSSGKKVVIITPEARSRLLESPEYQSYLRLRKLRGGPITQVGQAEIRMVSSEEFEELEMKKVDEKVADEKEYVRDEKDAEVLLGKRIQDQQQRHQHGHEHDQQSAPQPSAIPNFKRPRRN